MRIHINGARIIDPASGMDQQADIFIRDGKIVAIGDMPREFVAEQMIDASGLIAAPGLVDISTSLREPGYGRKGTIATETRAAAGTSSARRNTGPPGPAPWPQTARRR